MNIVVTGTGDKRGLGHLIADKLGKLHRVEGWTLAVKETTSFMSYTEKEVDVTKLAQVMIAERNRCERFTPAGVQVIVNCAGINRIGMLQDFSEEDFDNVMETNAKSIFLTSKALLPQLIESKGVIINIVSNASHMPMTGSLAYNASKGAAHIMTLQLARELTKKYGITVFGIAPNKLAGTGMSLDIDQQVEKTRGWTPEKVKEYQLAGLLSGEETQPRAIAELISFLLEEEYRYRPLTGTVIPYGA